MASIPSSLRKVRKASGKACARTAMKLRQVEQPENPKQLLPVLPEGVAEVDVSRELDKLLPAEARADADPIPVRLFVCYAHDDERQLKK